MRPGRAHQTTSTSSAPSLLWPGRAPAIARSRNVAEGARVEAAAERRATASGAGRRTHVAAGRKHAVRFYAGALRAPIVVRARGAVEVFFAARLELA